MGDYGNLLLLGQMHQTISFLLLAQRGPCTRLPHTLDTWSREANQFPTPPGSVLSFSQQTQPVPCLNRIIIEVSGNRLHILQGKIKYIWEKSVLHMEWDLFSLPLTGP